MDALAELNEAQRQAVMAGDGPVIIVAGPGTGKTKTLTTRIAYLLQSGAANPDEVLALTFTKKAAEEMRERVARLVPSASPHISTFHALCRELLGDELGFVTEPERLQVIKSLPRPATLKGISPRELALRISRAKNLAEDDSEIKKLAAAYDAALLERGVQDFDDLLVKVRVLLENDEAKRVEIQRRCRHILVDEFQDTNRLQYELLQLLRGTDNIFVIGDPHQSIYGFRGASGSIFDQFRADFPQHVAVTLTANYRSAPEVVRVANELFAGAAPLHSHAGGQGRVQVTQVLNEFREAAWVVNRIQQAIGGADLLRAVSDDDRAGQYTLQDFAILYRSRSSALAVQKAIDESGLPYQIVGDGSPYEQPHVLALIALLRGAAGDNAVELEGYSAGEIRAVQEILGRAGQISPGNLALRLMEILGFDHSPGLHQFVGTLVRFADVQAAVRYFDKIAETRFYDPAADAVTLLTIHASKGLEFRHVFLVGAEEGVLPHERADELEERRLFYVAATRARQDLDITHAKFRGGHPAVLSRFAAELSDQTLPKAVDPGLESDALRARKRAIKRSQQSLF